MLSAMHLQPHPSCCLFNADGTAPLRLLTDDGHADPLVSATPHGPLPNLSVEASETGCSFRAAQPPWRTSAWGDSVRPSTATINAN
jgi:hypothetical protein